MLSRFSTQTLSQFVNLVIDVLRYPVGKENEIAALFTGTDAVNRP
jgi:hypothetical protein